MASSANAKAGKFLNGAPVDIADRIPEYVKQFDTTAIELGSEESLPAGYTAGHSFGRRYLLDSLNEAVFYKDLEQMLYAYEALIDRGGTTPTDVMISEAGSGSIDEVRKYTLSKRIERSSNVRRHVLSKRAPICEGCGLDPELDYNYHERTIKPHWTFTIANHCLDWQKAKRDATRSQTIF